MDDIVSESVDTIISDKKKVKKWKVKFSVMEAFKDPQIVDSDSEPELYFINSINLSKSGKDSG